MVSRGIGAVTSQVKAHTETAKQEKKEQAPTIAEIRRRYPRSTYKKFRAWWDTAEGQGRGGIVERVLCLLPKDEIHNTIVSWERDFDTYETWWIDVMHQHDSPWGDHLLQVVHHIKVWWNKSWKNEKFAEARTAADEAAYRLEETVMGGASRLMRHARWRNEFRRRRSSSRLMQLWRTK